MLDEREKAIFLDAIEFEEHAQQDAHVANACKGDDALRVSVEALLCEHRRADNPVDLPIATHDFDYDVASASLSSESLGLSVASGERSQVGPYKLMEQIGEGGFGLVFVAEQLFPVKRRVALKVLKPGMDSRELIARFEIERQALAMMDHPNIAKVLDAGMTDMQRPFFVMELVKGIPITKFCEQKNLEAPERIRLFAKVCHAVQHAHHKGIIHRDIKPSNVLVTLHDGEPVPKVIDFGIAKAIGQSLTDKTVYTRYSAMIGTPMYMSPEQAELSSTDVDTRSDIYSLGILLYELLAGEPPYDTERLRSAGWDEIRRIIREEEPPPPSTKVAEQQHSTNSPGQPQPNRPAYTPRLAGDLDWIVLKAIDKDRTRRYETPNSLAADLDAFLHDQPIEARRPSTSYRIRKFVRRNRASMVATCAIALTLIVATGVSLRQARSAIEANKQKQRALNLAIVARDNADQARQRMEDFIERLKRANVMLAAGRRHLDVQDWKDAHAEFTGAINQQPDYYAVWAERAQLYADLHLWKLAVSDIERALEAGMMADDPNWRGLPQLLLHAERHEAYVEVCGPILSAAEAKELDDISIDNVRSCLLSPISPTAATSLAQVIETKLQLLPEIAATPFPAYRHFAMPHGAVLYVAGWAHFRAGDFQRAITRLEESRLDKFWPGGGIGVPLIAMSHFHLGALDQASKALLEAGRQRDEWRRQLAENPVASLEMPWFDWLEFSHLYSEAHELIRGTPARVDERREAATRRARSTLGLD